MSFRELAIILVVAIAVPALLLIRLVPMFTVEKSDAGSVARAFGRSQIWFYGGAGLALSIILLLKFC
jgi:hypothetical protein